MWAREVHGGIRVEDQLLLVPIDSHGESSAIALAGFPGEELLADAKGSPSWCVLLDLGKGERELADGLPVDHTGRLAIIRSARNLAHPSAALGGRELELQ